MSAWKSQVKERKNSLDFKAQSKLAVNPKQKNQEICDLSGVCVAQRYHGKRGMEMEAQEERSYKNVSYKS